MAGSIWQRSVKVAADGSATITSTSSQLTLDYDSNSHATIAVADASHTTISTGESGDLTLDAGDDIILDSHVGKWRMMRNGTLTNLISATAVDGSKMVFDNQVADAGYTFKCNDGGAGITALEIDAANAGNATFSGSVGAASLSATTTAVIGTDTTVGTAGNTNAVAIATVTNTGTTAGKDLKISAGSTTTGANNINGGDLILESGSGDGTGTSSMQFRTKVNGTDVAAERMRIHTDGNVGIGDAAPGTMLQVSGADAYLTLQNTTAENGEGAAETRIIFEDHAAASLGVIEVSHSGTADDTKGKMTLNTHNGSALTAAVTISDTQDVSFTSHVDIATSHAYKVNGTAILSDSSGTMTLSNVDALDATTEATIEGAIDTLSNLASVGTITTGTWQGTAIAQAYIADDAVSLAKMAGLARGKIIVGDASGNPSALALGSDTYVLTSDGSDAIWAAAGGGGGAAPNDADMILHMQVFA